MDLITELFAEDASVYSLKTGACFLKGKGKIRAAFATTKPHTASVSKRVFIDFPKKSQGEGSIAQGVTFCVDMHRAETSPGLGDVSRNTVLLYRCDSRSICNVWGMTDSEGLSMKPDLSLNLFLSSATWKAIAAIIGADIDIDTAGVSEHVHFNNYDTIDTWG